jgi:hypothetical protein
VATVPAPSSFTSVVQVGTSPVNTVLISSQKELILSVTPEPSTVAKLILRSIGHTGIPHGNDGPPRCRENFDSQLKFLEQSPTTQN